MWSSSSLAVSGTVVAVATSCVAAGVAVAEPSPKEKEVAKDAYADGLELREKGNLAGALEKFQLAYKLVPSPITGLAVAQTLGDLGRFVEARKVYREVAAMPPKASESPEAKAAREQAGKNAKALDTRVARVVVLVKGLPPGTEPDEVTIDGKPVAYSKAGTEIVVNPGKHLVGVASGSTKKAIEVEVGPGASVAVTVDWTTTSAVFPSDPSPPEVQGGTSTTSPLVWWGIGLGAVGLGVGVGGFLSWRGNEQRCKDFQSANGGVDCAPANRTAASTGLALGVVGSAVAVTGIGLLVYGLAHPEPAAATSASAWRPILRASISVSVSPMGVSILGRF